MKDRVIIFGSAGQLGRELKKKFINKFLVYSLNKKSKIYEGDITKFKTLEKTIVKIRPKIIINAAAYTKVDEAEKEKNICKKVNQIAVKNIAKLSKKYNFLLIHYSTDYIINNHKKKFLGSFPHKIKTTPINYYGKTKLDGEIEIFKNSHKFLILRTSWLYSLYKKNFLTTILKKINNREDIKVVKDQIGTPTSTKFLADISYYLVNKYKDNKKIKLVLNTVPNGHTSWFSFAKEINKISFKKRIKKIKIKAITSDKLNLEAKRPLYSKLDNQNLLRHVNIPIKSWRYYLKMLLK